MFIMGVIDFILGVIDVIMKFIMIGLSINDVQIY